ncbi:gamma-glutamylcyclotransferase [Pseudoalteromonas rubra]|uniref:Gamma-glutamylcyclotransferase n=1 Tax=Pseudoalteromonas rubra TaxID=43658 RepID=A0A5S3V3F2_9GAMM|nr:gamma-glutamylcyclotransferase family protein [Pseudoalteromonas rubra]MEC4088465.1 gamma-glutamylcyclotransferase family protein [Pseudoalteromonas rubra]QPB81983.1 gamma-glutamylcyclotransferase [Pseudoalteromonas rubra]
MADRDILNFAFGSNLTPARLQARLPAAQLLGTARLPGYTLGFRHLGQDGSAKCSIEPDDSAVACVHGVLYALTEQEIAQLDRIEGEGYQRQGVEVIRACGSRLTAHCYITQQFYDDLLPFSWYLEHVLRGVQHHQFPASYQQLLAKQPCTLDLDFHRARRELSIHQ